MNTDDIWHVRLYYSQYIYHVSECSVQCASGTRNREMTAPKYEVLWILINFLTFISLFWYSPIISSFSVCLSSPSSLPSPAPTFFGIFCAFPTSLSLLSSLLFSPSCFTSVECLEVLGVLVQNNGLVVCQPSPQKAVQQIASFVGEKDSSVRNAALNTLVIFYENMGDAVYKHVGRVSLSSYPSPPLPSPLSHPIYEQLLRVTLPLLPSSQIRTYLCWKKESAVLLRNLLPRPTQQSHCRLSSPHPTHRGMGRRRERTHHRSKRAE